MSLSHPARPIWLPGASDPEIVPIEQLLTAANSPQVSSHPCPLRDTVGPVTPKVLKLGAAGRSATLRLVPQAELVS